MELTPEKRAEVIKVYRKLRRNRMGQQELFKEDVCSICGDPNWPDGNHNAEPFNHGRCCGICNATKVVPERIRRIRLGMDPRVVFTIDTTKERDSIE